MSVVFVPYITFDNDLKVYYETFGDEKSYPIVLIHPLGKHKDMGGRNPSYFALWKIQGNSVRNTGASQIHYGG